MGDGKYSKCPLSIPQASSWRMVESSVSPYISGSWMSIIWVLRCRHRPSWPARFGRRFSHHNFLPQCLHSNKTLFLWTSSICAFNSLLALKVSLSHSEHFRIFLPPWTKSRCTFKLRYRVKTWSQILQELGSFPSWTDLMWLFMAILPKKSLAQIRQEVCKKTCQPFCLIVWPSKHDPQQKSEIHKVSNIPSNHQSRLKSRSDPNLVWDNSLGCFLFVQNFGLRHLWLLLHKAEKNYKDFHVEISSYLM